MVSMAAAIALGATSMSDIALLAHLAPLLGAAPSGPAVRRALAPALRPARTDLTSTNTPSDTEGGPPRRSRSRCTPGHTGNPAHPTAQSGTDTRIENGSRHNQ